MPEIAWSKKLTIMIVRVTASLFFVGASADESYVADELKDNTNSYKNNVTLLSESKAVSFEVDAADRLPRPEIENFARAYTKQYLDEQPKALVIRCKDVPQKLTKIEKRYAVYERNQRKKSKGFVDWYEPYLQPEAPLSFDLKKTKYDCITHKKK